MVCVMTIGRSNLWVWLDRAFCWRLGGDYYWGMGWGHGHMGKTEPDVLCGGLWKDTRMASKWRILLPKSAGLPYIT